MTQNQLIHAAGRDRHTTCCQDLKCVLCGSRVSGYNSNLWLHDLRPEARGWDWWQACDNGECPNSHGEGVFQCDADFAIEEIDYPETGDNCDFGYNLREVI